MSTRTRAGWIGGALFLMASSCGDDTEEGEGGAGSTSAAVTTTASGASTSQAASSGSGQGGGGQGGEGLGGGGGAGSVELVIEWQPCPLMSNGDPGPTVECATIQVPSRWDDPSSERIDYFVKRVPAAVQPARAQAWYLEGGPGAAGDSFDGLAAFVASEADDVDQYLPDHRGTGRSSRLGCSAEDPGTIAGSQIWTTEWSDCLADVKETWGDLVTAFTITNAARDVGEVIAATRAEGQQVIVFGGSYGTTLANRYLALYPDQPTAVGMSALAVNIPLDPADRWFNELGERWMGLCAEDPFCESRLGPDPWATMTGTFDRMDEGWCSEVTSKGLDRRLFQRIFASFFYAWWERALIPAMTYRLQRCNEDDVAAFDRLLDYLTTAPEPRPNDGYFSLVLNGLVATSEMWSEPPPPFEDFDAFRDEANVAQGLVESYAAHFDEWPRYETDEYDGVLATPTEHMLLLGGELDFIPAESREPALARFEGPGRPFLLMPRAGHTLGQSPYASGRPPCGVELLLQFILDPEGEIDASCADSVFPLDFDPPSGTLDAYFGSDDIWGAAPVARRSPARPPTSGPAPMRPELARALAPIREALLALGHRPAR